MVVVKCLGSKSEIASLDETFNELDHLRHILQTLADRLTHEEHWELRGAGEATGDVLDEGMVLNLGLERLERLVAAGRTLSKQQEG